jgi:CubicO group peptidase (beta-lactamase class C family)
VIRCIKRVALIATVAITATKAGAQTPLLKQAADSLRRLVQAGVMPSVAFSVSGRDGPIYEGAFGFADVEHRVKASPRTAYPVASVAKSYTAIAVLRAAERGALDLRAPVNSYLGADSVAVLVGDANRLTTRTLLHMTGGIPHVVRFYWPDEPRDARWDRRLGHFTAFPPGEQFYYSNASLGIAGEVLAHVEKKSYSQAMVDEVFRPLGLASTRVRLQELPQKLRARAYHDKPPRVTGFTRLDPEPGAGMYTSAHDLTTLARAVILRPKDGFLNAKSRAELTDFSSYPFYSSGWWKDPFRSTGLSLLADGAAFGHSASMKVLPAEGLAVAVIVNGGVDDGFTLGLCDLLLRAAGFTPPAPLSHEIPAEFVDRPVAKEAGWAGNWVGVVRAPSGELPIRIIIDSTGMQAAVGSADLQRVQGMISNGILEGRIPGELHRADVGGQAHTLGVRLRRAGDAITGYVAAQAKLTDRPFVVLPFYVSLKRNGL